MSSNPELKPCPFCGGKPECVVESVRAGYGEYESTENYHVVTCKNCHGTGPRYHQKHLIDFTNYKVSDFRNNPILRAKVEDDYKAFSQGIMQQAINAWNRRQP